MRLRLIWEYEADLLAANMLLQDMVAPEAVNRRLRRHFDPCGWISSAPHCAIPLCLAGAVALAG